MDFNTLSLKHYGLDQLRFKKENGYKIPKSALIKRDGFKALALRTIGLSLGSYTIYKKGSIEVDLDFLINNNIELSDSVINNDFRETESLIKLTIRF